jgi:hypothetical protein
MSEYQYYEFVAVDRPLSDEQVQALRALSTRARITSTRFVNHYDWGNFRGNPRALMEKCFDLFVYVANWGMRCFMMRLPRRLFDPASTVPYFIAEDVCSAWATKEHVILQFERSDIYEDDLAEYEFDDGSGWLAALAPLRQELLQGDQRCLYLVWLLCVQTGLVDDEAVEPPVPMGIQKLSASLQAFADFMALDPDLLCVATEAGSGETLMDLSHRELEQWIAHLPDQEKTELLVRLVAGDDPHLPLELRRRCQLSQSTGESERISAVTLGRRAGELLAMANQRAAERVRRAAELEAAERAQREREAAIARERTLDALAARGEAPWAEVEALVASKQPNAYDRAVMLLTDLRTLAERAEAGDDFNRRIEEIRERHARKPSFLKRLSQARLIATDQ